MAAQTQLQIQKDERSLGDLFSELAADTGVLVRQEVALAQVEISANNYGTLIFYPGMGCGASRGRPCRSCFVLSNLIRH